jgi:hypothetical protein
VRKGQGNDDDRIISGGVELPTRPLLHTDRTTPHPSTPSSLMTKGPSNSISRSKGARKACVPPPAVRAFAIAAALPFAQRFARFCPFLRRWTRERGVLCGIDPTRANGERHEPCAGRLPSTPARPPPKQVTRRGSFDGRTPHPTRPSRPFSFFFLCAPAGLSPPRLIGLGLCPPRWPDALRTFAREKANGGER